MLCTPAAVGSRPPATPAPPEHMRKSVCVGGWCAPGYANLCTCSSFTCAEPCGPPCSVKSMCPSPSPSSWSKIEDPPCIATHEEEWARRSCRDSRETRQPRNAIVLRSTHLWEFSDSFSREDPLPLPGSGSHCWGLPLPGPHPLAEYRACAPVLGAFYLTPPPSAAARRHASHGGGDESKELRTRSACTEPVRSLWQGRGVAHAGSWREGLRAPERGGAARCGHMYV